MTAFHETVTCVSDTARAVTPVGGRSGPASAGTVTAAHSPVAAARTTSRRRTVVITTPWQVRIARDHVAGDEDGSNARVQTFVHAGRRYPWKRSPSWSRTRGPHRGGPIHRPGATCGSLTSPCR